MEYTVRLSDELRVEIQRHDLSNVVRMSVGRWPIWTNIYLTQATARELAFALAAAGFDGNQNTIKEPEARP